MAKKTQGKNLSAPTSPALYIKEKARTLPIVLCRQLTDAGYPHILKIAIGRRRPRGKLIASIFTIDKFCLGVTSVTTMASTTPEEVETAMSADRTGSVGDISYPDAHSLIYGSVEFARKGGIEPHTGFSLGRMLLDPEESSPIKPADSFGLNGIATLVRNTDPLADLHIRTLTHFLGNNFRTVESVEQAIKSQPREFLSQPYTYHHPRYPARCKVKHQSVAEILLRKNQFNTLSLRDTNRILSLPSDQAAADISTVILYEIGRTYKAIAGKDEPPMVSGTLMHALMLLTRIESDKALRAISELIRQSPEFLDYHIGDPGLAMLPAALYKSGRHHLQSLVDLVCQSGISTDMRCAAVSVFGLVIHLEPERRNEIISHLRIIVNSLPERLPRLDGCDAEFAGVIVAMLRNIQASELLPEIREIYASGYIDQSICGTLPEVEKEIASNNRTAYNGCLSPDEAFDLYLSTLPPAGSNWV